MQLAAWLREALWRSSNWREELARIEPTAERALELAQALEYIEPERQRALAAYRRANAVERVRALAHELRAHGVIAEMALSEHQLLAAASAFVDANEHNRAEEVIARISDLSEAKTLKAIIRRDLRDPHRDISHYLSRAQQLKGDEAARMFVHAARIARLAGLDQMHANVLANALRKCPTDESILRLVEDRLLARGNADELLEHYRQRFESAQGPQQWVERVRAAATELVARGVQPGLGLRLLRRGLEHAYGAKLVEIPRHLATWEMLVTHAREARTLASLAPLVAEATALPLSDDDRIYLARLGIEIAGSDRSAAEPYVAMLQRLVPEEIEELDLDAAEIVDLKPPSPPPLPKPRAARTVISLDVALELHDGSRFSAIVRDVSISGLFVVTQHPLQLGAKLTLRLSLPAAKSTLEEQQLALEAIVVRRAEAGYGLAFVQPTSAIVGAIEALVRASAASY